MIACVIPRVTILPTLSCDIGVKYAERCCKAQFQENYALQSIVSSEVEQIADGYELNAGGRT